MRLFEHKTPEDHARAYCLSIGADPHALVKGYARDCGGRPFWCEQPRWRWYVGISEEALRRPIRGD